MEAEQKIEELAERIERLRQLNSKAPELVPGILEVLEQLAADVAAIRRDHEILLGGAHG